MKKTFKPEIEYIKFGSEDILTTSADPSMLAGFRKPPVVDTTNKSLTQEYYADPNNLWNINQ